MEREDTTEDLTRELEYRNLPVTEKTLRCMLLVTALFRGMHHAPRTIRALPGGLGMELILAGKTFDTYDCDDMTRLVFLAHDLCIRAEISTRGMRLALMLHPRDKREGSFFERHPTVESALARWRKRNPMSECFVPAVTT